MKHLDAEEATRDINLLTPHNDNLLPTQNLLRDYGRKPAQEMALAINDDGARGEGGHGCLWWNVALRFEVRRFKSSEMGAPSRSTVSPSSDVS